MLNRLRNTLPPFLKLMLIVSLLGLTRVAHAQTVEFREISYMPLGNATLNLIGTPQTGVLSIENIGVSGLDGAAAELLDVCFYSSRWEALPGPDNGALLRFHVRGRLGEVPDQSLGVAQFEVAGAELSLAVDLIPGGVFPNQMRVVDGFATRYSGVIADTGIVATAATWPDEMALESACSDAISSSLTFSWDDPTTISIVGGPAVIADAVAIMSSAFRSDFSAVHLQAAGISPVVILDAMSALGGAAASDPASSPLTLSASVPNPFNPRTEIQFWMARPATALLVVHDTQGRLVRTLLSAHRDAGAHSVVWDGTDAGGIDVGSGVYLVSLMSGGEIRTQKVTLLR